MAAEAEVDFIGKDDTLNKTLKDLRANVEGLSGKLSGALKIGLGLFSAEKVLGFGKAVVRAAAESDKFKDSWAGVNDSVDSFMTALGGPVVSLLEGLIPTIDEIGEHIDDWGSDFLQWIREQQRNLSGFLTMVAHQDEFASPEAAFRAGTAEYDRQRGDIERDRNRRRAEREAAKEKPFLDAELKEGELMPHLERMGELKKQSQEIQGKLFAAVQKNFMQAAGGLLSTAPSADSPFMFGRFGNREANKFERGAAGLFKDIGRNIGEGSNSFAAIGKAVGDAVSDVVGKDGKGFTAQFEGVTELFKRVQGAAASTPEKEAAKKTATQTEKTAVHAEKTSKLLGDIKSLWESGQALVAKYS